MVFQFHSAPTTGDNQFIKKRCETFKYEITVPAHWNTDEVTLEKKHIFVSYFNKSEIRIRAFLTEEDDIESTVRKQRWNLRSIDPLLNNIIETKKIHIRKNIRDKLLVFEYRSNKQKVLQRTMISRGKDIIYIVDCKAPLRSFYMHEKFFNIALSSFSIIGEVQDENTGLEDDEGTHRANSINQSNTKIEIPKNDAKKDDEDDTF